MFIAADGRPHPKFLVGGGAMGALIRDHDWGGTPLGRPEGWPQSLRSALSICLHSSFPTAIYWGPELRLLYNDAWAQVPAERHPWALGRPAAEVWADIWPIVGPQFAAVMERGESVSLYDQLLPMVRCGVARETYWNYSLSPIRGEDSAVMGVFNQGNETTAAVVARREAEAEIDRLGRLFEQAPGAVAILRGPRHMFEMVNPACKTLVGREDLVGQALAEALPEVEAQGFVGLLDRVYATGAPHVGRAAPVMLLRGGAETPEERIIDFVFQPLTDGEGARNGVFVQAADVSETARALSALSASEEKFHAIVNSIDQMIWSTRPDGRHDYFNARWYAFTGTPEGSTDGDAWNGLFHPEDRDRAQRAWSRCLETGEPYHIEYRLRHRSGQYRWVIGRAQCVRDASGAVTRWFGSCTDVHDLKSAEGELAEQARVLEILNRTGETIAAELGLERVVRTIVDAGVALTGAAFGAFVQAPRADPGPDGDVDAPDLSDFPLPPGAPLFAAARTLGDVLRADDIETDARLPDGVGARSAPVRSLLAVPLADRTGAPIGALLFGHWRAAAFSERGERLAAGVAAQAAIAIDNARLFRAAQREIAERMRTEAELRESEEFSRSVLQSSGDCVVVMSVDSAIGFVNDNGLALLEVGSPGSILGALWSTLWPVDCLKEAEAAIEAARCGGVGRFSAAARAARGGDRWWDVVVAPVAGRDGAPSRLVATLRDVREQRRAEEARQLLVRELNHRVKNLFAVASGMVTMTARSSATVEAMSEALRGRLNALAKAHELIRPAINEDEAHEETTRLRALVEQVAAPHLDGAAPNQLTVDGPDIALTLTPATALALILHEFATNAAKYGALGTPDGRLAITWRVEGETLALRWDERVPGARLAEPQAHGFGSRLARSSATGQLGGEIAYDWRPEGVHISLRAPLARLAR